MLFDFAVLTLSSTSFGVPASASVYVYSICIYLAPLINYNLYPALRAVGPHLPPSSPPTVWLQLGHLLECSSHWLIHASWNVWKHGKTFTFSPSVGTCKGGGLVGVIDDGFSGGYEAACSPVLARARPVLAPCSPRARPGSLSLSLPLPLPLSLSLSLSVSLSLSLPRDKSHSSRTSRPVPPSAPAGKHWFGRRVAWTGCHVKSVS